MANRMTYSVKVDSIFSIGEQIFNRRKGTSPVKLEPQNIAWKLENQDSQT